jgi:hypothetical protein
VYPLIVVPSHVVIFALQLAVVQEFIHIHVQFHGPLHVIVLGVHPVHRFVVGLVDGFVLVVVLCDVPHVPFIILLAVHVVEFVHPYSHGQIHV